MLDPTSVVVAFLVVAVVYLLSQAHWPWHHLLECYPSPQLPLSPRLPPAVSFPSLGSLCERLVVEDDQFRPRSWLTAPPQSDSSNNVAHHVSLAQATPAPSVTQQSATSSDGPSTERVVQGTVCPHGHSVQFYEDSAYLCQSVANFVSEGLMLGEGVLIIATPEHLRIMEKSIKNMLEVKQYKKRGQLLCFDAVELLPRIMAGLVPDQERFQTTVSDLIDSVAAIYPVVRVYGELVNLLVAEGNANGAVALERMWNTLQRTCAFTLHCGYALSEFDKPEHNAAFDAVCQEHCSVIPTETYAALVTDADQRRLIAQLQQRAIRLENEISERRAIEAALRKREGELMRANEEAKAASRAKSAFLANVSHEIRTPLSAIVGFTELLMSPKNAEESHEAVSIIHRQGKELTRLLNDILDLSKIESGCLQTEILSFPLTELLGDVRALLNPMATEKGIMLTIHDKTDAQLIRSDPARLRQVLMNVIGNALKFTARGTVDVVVELVMHNDGLSKMLMCRVRDTGCGITPTQAMSLFQPFSQGDSSISRRYGGTGLGLCLSRQICRMLGGDLELEHSLPGVGSTFVISVEAGSVQFHMSHQTPPEDTGPLKALNHEPAEMLSILVVDDNDMNRLLLLRVLGRMGFNDVTTAYDGESALNLLDKRSFDIILLDIQMPGMSGYEVCAMMRDMYATKKSLPQPVIIACTADAMRGDQERCSEVGFDDYISKPINFQDLRGMLTLWSNGRNAREGLM